MIASISRRTRRLLSWFSNHLLYTTVVDTQFSHGYGRPVDTQQWGIPGRRAA